MKNPNEERRGLKILIVGIVLLIIYYIVEEIYLSIITNEMHIYSKTILQLIFLNNSFPILAFIGTIVTAIGFNKVGRKSGVTGSKMLAVMFFIAIFLNPLLSLRNLNIDYLVLVDGIYLIVEFVFLLG